MLVDELATNSMNYGALSRALGKLAISGHDLSDQVEIIWKETGGPPVVSPAAPAGFGSKLLMKTINEQLGGTMNVDWSVEGIVVALRLSKACLGT